MLKLHRQVAAAIRDHAARELPYEACGYLAGKEGEVSRHYELNNMDQAADHFSMEPGEQFAAVKDMRSRGLTMRAVYHSHPETRAWPSTEDIRLAYDAGISYVIISLAGKEPEMKSFRIRQGEVVPESIEIIG